MSTFPDTSEGAPFFAQFRAFPDFQVFPSIPASLVAGASAAVPPVDLILSRFGWADLTTGIVQNTRTTSAQALGFIPRLYGRWTKVYADALGWHLHSGFPVTVASAGVFYTRFAAGALVSQPVYASTVDGSAISGYNGLGELTPWIVSAGCDAGYLGVISTQEY